SVVGEPSAKEKQAQHSQEVPSQQSEGGGGGNSRRKKQHSEKWRNDTKQNFSHPWLVTSLKGHGGAVLDMDFSPNGKFLATCAEDRAVFIWNTKDWKGKEHKSLRQNIELDHASLIKWAPNSKALIINRATENQIEIYKVNKTDTWITCSPSGIKFPKLHEDETISIGISVTGKYMMSCSTTNQLTIWDLKGTVLETLDTYLIKTYNAKVSPCGRFVAASGFAPDVKVWEVVFKKTGEFSKVTRAFELKGHTAAVYDFGFNCDSSKMATVSKDGTWKVFNTKIEFEKGEDPHLILTGNNEGKARGMKSKIAFSPNGEVVAISSVSAVALYSALTGEMDALIDEIYPGSINALMFDAASELLLTAGDKHIRVFHNVTGRRTTIATANEKLKQSANSAATKERLQSIIKEAEQFLVGLGEDPNAEA
ncbi:hypothetical protein LSTR_LSTR000360, partial [Laodelphax striatellus]